MYIMRIKDDSRRIGRRVWSARPGGVTHVLHMGVIKRRVWSEINIRLFRASAVLALGFLLANTMHACTGVDSVVNCPVVTLATIC
jgi:hypothetical protein